MDKIIEKKKGIAVAFTKKALPYWFGAFMAAFILYLPILTMCLSGHRKYPLGTESQAVAERSMQIMQGAIDFAVSVGIRIIQLAGYDEYYNESNETTRKNFELRLGESVRLAAKKGVILAFETMETPFMNTVEKSKGR